MKEVITQDDVKCFVSFNGKKIEATAFDSDENLIAQIEAQAIATKQLAQSNLVLTKQRDELLEACKAFIRYDEGDQEDGVALMIDYAEANQLIRSAVANAEK